MRESYQNGLIYICSGSENVDDKLYSPESDSTTEPEPEPKPEPSTVPGLESKKNSVDRERKTGSVAMADAYKVFIINKRPKGFDDQFY